MEVSNGAVVYATKCVGGKVIAVCKTTLEDLGISYEQ